GPIGDNDLALMRLFSTNIAIGFENLSLVEKLDQLAYEDPTLRIPNQNALLQLLSTKIRTAPGSSRMALLRIDGLQNIVATYGLLMTNTLLLGICEDLAAKVGPETTVGKIADATFALVGPKEAFDCATFEALFSAPFIVDGIEITATATTSIIEIADLPDHPDEALRKAVTALIAVKQQRPGSTAFFDQEMQARHDRARRLKEALKDAACTGSGISVALQPKFDLLTSKPVGAEALMRWTLEGEAVSPAEFIPIAEASGLTRELTMLVVREIGRWNRERTGLPPLAVAINLSMFDLNNLGFVEALNDCVRLEGMGPDLIEFEVTESIAMATTPWAINQAEALRDAGYRISLDDFGTGYSSLSHFRELPIQVVKIDRSFVQELDIVTARTSLAATVLAMSQSLAVDCVAEGIETEAQRQALVFLGCTVGQGFLLGRPTPIDQFDATFETS
ncbi:MAG: sensor domain-containing phosphodiesterase, partial [Thalassobaculaceae bacterium]|nr:sensor domain-containing phosphodiesterase [Thalassobaculaceae bacterium]